MRKNLPVTNKERQFDPKRPIVSITDLKGNIRYPNQAFTNISGFSREELIGQPQNIIRHPDMPAEAFEDMWRTLKANLPWRGLVKNRTKNGDHYWVDAFVTPIFENDEKVGYMSVRGRPQPGKVEEAEALYAAVKQKQATFPRTRYPRQVSLTARLALLVGIPALCSVGTLLSGGTIRWVIELLGITAATGLGIWTFLGIRAPLLRVTSALHSISQGDLNFEIDTKAAGEFAYLLIGMQAMKIHLRAMFSDMIAIANDVEAQSRQLNGQVESVTQRIHQGADNICSVAATIEQMSASVSEISQSTSLSAEQATATAGLVDHGVGQITSTLKASREVVGRMHGAKAMIAELGGEVASIQRLAQMIKGIADQTNLLALNAAIEAARAGESGRGFAVVADEVRKLAERTTSSTVEIATTVKRIGTCSAQTLAAMSAAMSEVENSDHLMDDSRRTFDAIKTSADDIQSSARNIAAMLQQQDRSSSEVAQRVEQISQLAEHNSSSVKSICDAAALLGNTAHELKMMTSRFERSL